MTAKIYKPSRTATQSGNAKTKRWVLEYAISDASRPNPLMGWPSSKDTQKQIKLFFSNCDEAISYAKSNKIDYTVIQPSEKKHKIKGYADNFSYASKQSWTH